MGGNAVPRVINPELEQARGREMLLGSPRDGVGASFEEASSPKAEDGGLKLIFERKLPSVPIAKVVSAFLANFEEEKGNVYRSLLIDKMQGYEATWTPWVPLELPPGSSSKSSMSVFTVDFRMPLKPQPFAPKTCRSTQTYRVWHGPDAEWEDLLGNDGKRMSLDDLDKAEKGGRARMRMSPTVQMLPTKYLSAMTSSGKAASISSRISRRAG